MWTAPRQRNKTVGLTRVTGNRLQEMSETMAVTRDDSGDRTVTVELSLEIEASADRVWSMVSTGEGFSAFMQGRVSLEARSGAPFRAEFPNYGVVLAGEVARVEGARVGGSESGARTIAITWGSELGPQAADLPAGSSLVEIRVEDAPSGCRVGLRHSGFPSRQLAREHEDGWRFHLGRLALEANRADLGAGLARTLPLWFAAWNDTDPGRRLATLGDCCAASVEFQDDWAVARGIERLNLHITNCHRFMPGWKIEPTGEPGICRGEALVGWRSTGPSGAEGGHNHIRASHDGTILRVAGFRME